MPQSDQQQTLVLIKPDALKNSLTGYVLSYLSEFHTSLRFAGVKIVHVTGMLAEEHYAEHRGKLFYPSLIEYITGVIHYPATPERRRVIAIVYQGSDAVRKIRDIAGPTNPLIARETKPGCIRALGTLAPIKDGKGATIGERMDNLIHASATLADAEREIKLWFKPHDIPPSMHPYATAACGEHYYFSKGKLTTRYSGGSICVLAPGNVAWKSDLEALTLIAGGSTASVSLETVVAKYLVNEEKENP
ncbi:MAG: nucleoside-diphosphate kinase [Chitinispirillaceae bacterium]|nr:nucleoside-diphosphate kinase [Chitinispirillaceae bacterium]